MEDKKPGLITQPGFVFCEKIYTNLRKGGLFYYEN